MATLHPAPAFGAERAERRFFFIMAAALTATIVSGFMLNLAMGRSSFAAPLVYHLHAAVFMGWLALFMVQTALIDAGNVRLHRRIGLTALVMVPVMVAMGFAVMIASLRRTGGPFFFDQNEFLVCNSLLLLVFAGLVGTALAMRRDTAWHRRLMMLSLVVLTGPGIGRLLPMPLMMPHAWRIHVAILLMIPVIGMIADKRRSGRVHPAWIAGMAAIAGAQILGDVIAYSPLGESLVRQVVAGTPGAADGGLRPAGIFDVGERPRQRGRWLYMASPMRH